MRTKMRILGSGTVLALLLCGCSLPSLSAAQRLRQQGERQDDDGTSTSEDPYYERVPSIFDAYDWERNAQPRTSSQENIGQPRSSEEQWDQVEQENVERAEDTSTISESLIPYLDRFTNGGNDDGNGGIVDDEWYEEYVYNEIEAKGKGKGMGMGKHKKEKGHYGKGKGKGRRRRRRRRRHKGHYKRRFKHTYIPDSDPSPQPSPNVAVVPTRIAPSNVQPPSIAAEETPTAFPSSAIVDGPTVSPGDNSLSTDTPTVPATAAPTVTSAPVTSETGTAKFPPSAAPMSTALPATSLLPSSESTDNSASDEPQSDVPTIVPPMGSDVPSNLEAPPDTPPNVVPVGRFTVDYAITGTADEAAVQAAADLTGQYLEMYLVSQFDLNNEATLLEVVGTVVSVDPSIPQGTFDIELVFDPTSSAIPSTEDVDVLLFAAFNEPFVQGLLSQLQQQPDPFSSTSGVTYALL